MKTAVVILNYNTKGYLERFLPGLISSCEGLDAEVIVADNASSDGSAEYLKDNYPSLRLISMSSNLGFAGGYNKALEEIEAEYYVLINSDVEVTPSWLGVLQEWMDSHPRCAACGPKLLSFAQRDSFEYAGAAGGYLDRFGYPYCRGRVLQNVEKDNGQYNNPLEVLWCSGACLMVRASAWKETGGFDSRFFAHMEEIDLCWRMQLAGWSVVNVPTSAVYHIGGGTLPNESPFKLRLNFRNNLLMLENNLPATYKAFTGAPDCVCRFRTRCKIFFRMCLDGGSALVYLLGGKWDFFKSVLHAHMEYRALRTRGNIPSKPFKPAGLEKRIVVLRALLSKSK